MPKLDSRRRITLPEDLCKQAGLEPGDELACFLINDRITVTKAAPHDSKGRKLSSQVLAVHEHADRVFHSHEAAVEWMTSPQRGLGMHTPSDLLTSDEGIQQVDDLLGRIEHGDYS